MQQPNLPEILKKENPSLADFGLSIEDYQNSSGYFRKIPYTWTEDCKVSKKAWLLMAYNFDRIMNKEGKISY